MKTFHKIIFSNSQDMSELADESVDIVVTSPPYPMIKMWDEIFASFNPKIMDALDHGDGKKAFYLMHTELDKVWEEVIRVVKIGGFICINIGDATRTLNNDFMLYPSHAHIINYFTSKGFSLLPVIIWRKPTNSPTKFLGSGMLPPGAYVTLEHEYILIFRKGKRRAFKDPKEKQRRLESAFFWEERNIWFSDIWEIRGVNQKLSWQDSRERSGAFPFELAYRLINMYSIKRDIVLDPFLGTGTTLIAALVAERNSIGYEIDTNFKAVIEKKLKDAETFGNNIIQERLDNHRTFIENRVSANVNPKYINKYYQFPVITSQEVDLKLSFIKEIIQKNVTEYWIEYECQYH